MFIYCRPIEVKDNEISQEFQTPKTLSMILEASKERNSSTSSGIVSTIPSVIKAEQQSTIDFGMVFILNYCTFYPVSVFGVRQVRHSLTYNFQKCIDICLLHVFTVLNFIHIT